MHFFLLVFFSGETTMSEVVKTTYTLLPTEGLNSDNLVCAYLLFVMAAF